MDVQINAEAEKLVTYLFGDSITVENIVDYLNNRLWSETTEVLYRGEDKKTTYTLIFRGVIREFSPANTAHCLQFFLPSRGFIYIMTNPAVNNALVYSTTFAKESDKKVLNELVGKLNSLLKINFDE